MIPASAKHAASFGAMLAAASSTATSYVRAACHVASAIASAMYGGLGRTLLDMIRLCFSAQAAPCKGHYAPRSWVEVLMSSRSAKSAQPPEHWNRRRALSLAAIAEAKAASAPRLAASPLPLLPIC